MSLFEAPKERGCTNCCAAISAGLWFCPVCGIRAPKVERMTIVRYGGVMLSEAGRAYVCPHCDNEEQTDGDFCIICGSNVVNRCADSPGSGINSVMMKGCGAKLPGNARYCSKCGNEGTFFQTGWLCDWKSENPKKAIRNTRLANLIDVRVNSV